MFGRKKKATLAGVIATFTTAMDDLTDIVDNEEIAQKEKNDEISSLQAQVVASEDIAKRAGNISKNISALIDA